MLGYTPSVPGKTYTNGTLTWTAQVSDGGVHGGGVPSGFDSTMPAMPLKWREVGAGSKLSSGAIVGIVVAVLAVTALGVVVGVMVRKK